MLKPSRFNFTFCENDKTYIFNSRSLAYGAMSSTLFNGALRLVDKLNNGSPMTQDAKIKEAAFMLRRGGFLTQTPDAELNPLMDAFASQKVYNGHTGITIATTQSCNFSCPYCYEDCSNTFMDKEVMEMLVRYVAMRTAMPSPKSVYITWYGGEPLLPRSLETVRELSLRFQEICKERDVAYSANMITNGYLLTRNTATELSELGVGHLQITLDGTEETHDAKRRLRNGKGTFRRILNNIKECNPPLRISVRMNVSKENGYEAQKLKDLLIDEGVMADPDRSGFYVSPVRTYTSSCKSSGCYALSDFYDFELDLLRKGINANGFNIVEDYPSHKINVCGSAVSEGALVVGPDGRLYKCWLDVGREAESVGRLTMNGPEIRPNSKWDSYSPFNNSQCKSCSVLPLCMGGCPELNIKSQGTKNNNEACCNWKFVLKGYLKLHAEAAGRLGV